MYNHDKDPEEFLELINILQNYGYDPKYVTVVGQYKSVIFDNDTESFQAYCDMEDYHPEFEALYFSSKHIPYLRDKMKYDYRKELLLYKVTHLV